MKNIALLQDNGVNIEESIKLLGSMEFYDETLNNLAMFSLPLRFLSSFGHYRFSHLFKRLSERSVSRTNEGTGAALAALHTI